MSGEQGQPLDPAYADIEVCACSTPGWTHHTGFHMFVEDREKRAVRRARAEGEAQANTDRATVLSEAADALEGGLGLPGTPLTLWEFRQWLRDRAASTPQTGEPS